MAADLFETYAVTVVATMVLASIFFNGSLEVLLMNLPLAIGGVCIVSSIIGTYFVKISKDGSVMGALYKGLIVAGVLAILGYGLVVWSMQFIEIAYVSSIREISIVLATLLSFYLLKEKDSHKRIMPSIIICTGITILYFQIT